MRRGKASPKARRHDGPTWLESLDAGHGYRDTRIGHPGGGMTPPLHPHQIGAFVTLSTALRTVVRLGSF